MDYRIRVVSYKEDDRRLLNKMFKSKPIKRKVKSHFDSSKKTFTQTLNKCLHKSPTTM